MSQNIQNVDRIIISMSQNIQNVDRMIILRYYSILAIFAGCFGECAWSCARGLMASEVGPEDIGTVRQLYPYSFGHKINNKHNKSLFIKLLTQTQLS